MQFSSALRSSSHATSSAGSVNLTNQTNTLAPIHRANLRPSCKSLLLLPITSTLGILALVSTFFISADSVSNSYALNGTNLQSEVTAEIDGTHYVTLSASDAAFSITPTNGTASDKKQVNVDLSTNVSGGASLYLSTSSSKNALYLNGDTNSTNKNIASASSTTTYDNMVNNTWGYSTDDINYQGVPTLDSPVLLSDIDGISTGTNTNGVVSATIPIYYAAKVDTSIPSGSYANSVTYLAVVDGGIVTSAELTSITVDGNIVEQLQLDKTNTILITTNLKTNTYGIPRVYYTTTDPAGYSECTNVIVSSNTDGYMTIQCETTPTTVATGITLHIVPKGSSEDTFCTDGTYEANTSQCEAGEWKWGSFTVGLPDVAEPLAAMQTMTPELCASWDDDYTTRMVDLRDNKVYWVAKLKDGNCWMTQNLELDLSTDVPLTSELSDVTSSWTPTRDTYFSAKEGNQINNMAQSYNLGKYVWKYSYSVSGCSPDVNLGESACDSYWQDVSSWTPMPEYRTDGVTYDASSQTYDAHYLAGNYYSYVAATAGTGASATSNLTKATDSICPKGFELPTSGSSFRYSPGSFYNLLGKYGFESYPGYPGSGANSPTRSPLFFVYSGYIPPMNGLDHAGKDGHYWSSVAYSSSRAYSLYFGGTTSTSPSDDITRYSGLSVRCVALSN